MNIFYNFEKGAKIQIRMCNFRRQNSNHYFWKFKNDFEWIFLLFLWFEILFESKRKKKGNFQLFKSLHIKVSFFGFALHY